MTNSDTMTELETMLTGKKLGEGGHRAVYVLKAGTDDKERVIKVAKTRYGRQHNIKEYAIWDEIRHSDISKWFIPCLNVSDSGNYVIQNRAKPIRVDELPKQVPTFFQDLTQNNWGLWGGQPRCLDYGSINLAESLTDELKDANFHIN